MEPNKSTKTKIVPGEKKVAPVQEVNLYRATIRSLVNYTRDRKYLRAVCSFAETYPCDREFGKSECAADQDKNVVFRSMVMLGKIDDKYDMTESEMLQIQEFYKQGILGAIRCAFRWGYLRGTEATELPEDIKNIVGLLEMVSADKVREAYWLLNGFIWGGRK